MADLVNPQDGEIQQDGSANRYNNDEITKAVVIVDTRHTDEAMKVFALYDGEQEWTENEENQLRRKIDRRLLPVLCATYGLQYYDKAMISQAALFGLLTDLELTGNRYSMSSSIFYLGFIVGTYPAIWMAQRWPIERVASSIVLVWGVCLMCTAACHNYQSLYAQRFILGVLESGISPMFMLIVGQFYKKDEQALRMGVWYCSTAYVQMFSPLINYGIGHINGAWSPWRYMYLVAGSLTVIWAAVIYFFMPPDPIRAKGFSQRERYIAVARLRINNTGVRNTHFKKDQVLDLILDIKFWVIFAIAFLSMIANGPVSTFGPIIIAGFGFSVLNSLLLVMPAGFLVGTLDLLAPYIATKYSNLRAYIAVFCECLTILSALLLWLLPQSATGALLFALYILPCFGGAYTIIMGLQIANCAGYTKRSLASSMLFIGYCLGAYTLWRKLLPSRFSYSRVQGNFVGPLVFKEQDGPEYSPGFRVVVVTSILSGGLTILYRVICVWENRKRDKAGTAEGYDHAYEDDLTDRKVTDFSY